VLRAPELEREHDLGDAAEQCQQPNPADQQRSTGRERLLGSPEADEDHQDARDHAEPPDTVDDPRLPNVCTNAQITPARKDDAQQDLRPLPVPPDGNDQEFEMICHAIPVSRNTHHELPSRPRQAGAQGLLSLRSCRVCLLMRIPLRA
jgi:hypothetical protein